MMDLDNMVMYSSYIDGCWHFACFYETDDKTVTVYTARVVKRIESYIE
jgi:hypothetical protein